MALASDRRRPGDSIVLSTGGTSDRYGFDQRFRLDRLVPGGAMAWAAGHGTDRMDAKRAATLLEALGDPTRLAMVREPFLAGEAGLPVATLQELIGIESGSTTSKHLGRLRQVGLVTRERRSTTSICRVSHKAVDEIVDFLV